MNRKSDYIRKIANMCKTSEHELLIELMRRHNVTCLADLTREQCIKFYEEVKCR